jgi:hypothetical protein
MTAPANQFDLSRYIPQNTGIPNPKTHFNSLATLLRWVTVSVAFLAVATLGTAQNPPQLQISSPTNGSIFNPGQTLSVTVTSPANIAFTQVAVVGQDPIGVTDIATSVPAQFSLTIPANIASRKYMLTASGLTASGQSAQSATILIEQRLLSFAQPVTTGIVMMLKLLKAFATLAILAVLFFLDSKLFKPRAFLVVLFILTVSYGISLAFSTKLPAYRRWGIAYLVFVGITYLIAGILGLLPHGGLVESMLWHGLISPYPLFRMSEQGLFRHAQGIDWGAVYVFPFKGSQLFSGAIVLLSSVSILAAIAMSKGKRNGYNLWLAMVCASVMGTLAYVVAGFLNWGLQEAILPLCWTASYIAAYVAARKGAKV